MDEVYWTRAHPAQDRETGSGLASEARMETSDPGWRTGDALQGGCTVKLQRRSLHLVRGGRASSCGQLRA